MGDYRASGVPPLLEAQMIDALESLEEEIDAEDAAEVRQAAIEVARASLDFHLRHRPPAEIDRARFALWARQILVDVAAAEPDAVSGDVATLEWTLDRFAHTLDAATRTGFETILGELRAAAEAGNLAAATDAAARLRDALD